MQLQPKVQTCKGGLDKNLQSPTVTRLYKMHPEAFIGHMTCGQTILGRLIVCYKHELLTKVLYRKCHEMNTIIVTGTTHFSEVTCDSPCW